MRYMAASQARSTLRTEEVNPHLCEEALFQIWGGVASQDVAQVREKGNLVQSLGV